MDMNSLEDELNHCLLSAQAAGSNEATLAFCYPETFNGFRGHFPGDPILPGVCILQSVRIGLERLWNHSLRLVGIVDAKFISRVKPDDVLDFTVRETAREAGVVTVKSRVTRKGERVAELTLKLERIPES